MARDTFDPFDLPSTFDPLQSQTPPPAHRPRPPSATSPPTQAGAGDRLAHLLSRAEPATAEAHLAALEDGVAILAARLDRLHTALDTRLDDQRKKLVKAVAALLDERLGPRR